LVASDQPQDPARFALITTNALSDLQLDKIDHDHPSRPEDMNVGRRMIVWVITTRKPSMRRTVGIADLIKT
jgi:hypothetical protein